MTPTWGYENRTVALRVPAGDHKAMRIEHRVAGADANPYLVATAIIAGMLYGIENKLAAPEPITGNAYTQIKPSLPSTWLESIEQLLNIQSLSKNTLEQNFSGCSPRLKSKNWKSLRLK